MTMLNVSDLKIYFRTRGAPVRAVDGVSLSIDSGETLALVGESGCGKSVTALSLTRLIPQPPAYYAGGKVDFDGKSVLSMDMRSLRRLRGAEISYVFQEPATSLNPVIKVGHQIGEAIRLHRRDAKTRSEVVRLLKLVGISDPERRANSYPLQLSGGMQQRVMIAMALACSPRLLVADEPTTALDVTIQAQILELLADLQRKLNMGILLITHNLGLVADVAHRVSVMYAGRIVESGPVEDILENPLHPYTRRLLNAVPKLSGDRGRMEAIKGTVPNPAKLPPGCAFNPRCPLSRDLCLEKQPELESVDDSDGKRLIRCHYWK